jgi:hypothetical protein
MKRIILYLFSVFLLLLLSSAHVDAGSFRRGGGFRPGGFGPHSGFVGRRPPFFIMRPGPNFFPRYPFFGFGHPNFFFPGRPFIGQPLFNFAPFFCFADGLGFINEASFFDHLHRFHGIAFETIPTVIVPNGPQFFFFGP